MEAGQQISDAALASLVNFFAAAGASFAGESFSTPQQLWAYLHTSVYGEFIDYLQSDESDGNAISPDAILTLAKLTATEQAGGNQATRRRTEHIRRVNYCPPVRARLQARLATLREAVPARRVMAHAMSSGVVSSRGKRCIAGGSRLEERRPGD